MNWNEDKVEWIDDEKTTATTTIRMWKEIEWVSGVGDGDG